MSKAKREQQHKRRFLRDAQRKAVKALAAGAVIAAGTQAYAVPVRFDNPAHGSPGHFEWAVTDALVGLDITGPADQQPVVPGMAAVPYFRQYSSTYYPGGYGKIVRDNQFPNNPDDGFQHAMVETSGYMLVGVDAGTIIPSGADWRNNGIIELLYYGFESLLPEGVPTYLGAKFQSELDGPWYYGWIGVVRGAPGLGSWELDTFAWGYETDPGVGVPAGVPEPGSLALLALGAAGVATRRRRKG